LRKIVFASLLCLVLVPWPVASQGTKKAEPPRKTAAKSSKRKSTRRVVRRPLTQQQPTPERYREIQQALIDKGYLQGPATGTWGPDSVAALKRFQAEQKLEATGKLGALSLIQLGLGPKREAASQNGRLPPPEPKAAP
jgi:peptidoglycan hydrolase-like protein with peptidoglycan-binding domain